jgi:hypothetical protein
MGESISAWIWWLANVPSAGRWFFLVILGIRAASRWVLGKFYGITMAAGLELYPERQALDKHSDLEESFKNTESVEAYSVIGFTLINKLSHPERYIKKLLLPNPDCNSLINLETTTNRKGHFTSTIKTVTKSALDRKIPIKWYREFIGYSFLIVDRNKDNGWLHVEFVLPHTTNHLSRPSIRVRKNKQLKIFNHFVQAFDDMWDASEKPNLDK